MYIRCTHSTSERAWLYVGDYRDRVDGLKEDDPDDMLVLDSYTSEMVLGRHLEAVMSAHPFAEPA